MYTTYDIALFLFQINILDLMTFLSYAKLGE